jgi:hypothetical protein
VISTPDKMTRFPRENPRISNGGSPALLTPAPPIMADLGASQSCIFSIEEIQIVIVITKKILVSNHVYLLVHSNHFLFLRLSFPFSRYMNMNMNMNVKKRTYIVVGHIQGGFNLMVDFFGSVGWI